jgi:hypothetical protein
MTTKQKKIIIKNLEEVIGVTTGKSVKGKGLEIFESNKSFDGSWSYGLQDGSFFKRISEKIAKDPTIADRLVITEFRRENETVRRNLKPYEFPSITDILTGVALTDCTEINLELKGTKLYGHLPLSKYNAKEITSMYQLVKDVNTLVGYKTSDQVLDSSYDEFDKDITFKGEGECSTGGYYSKYSDHCHVHGGLSVMNPDWKEVVEIDGRLSNYNDGVVSDFWDTDLDCEKEYLNELDPKDNIAVYHRKGKDWFVGYTLHSEEYELYYLDDDGEEECVYAQFQYYKEDEELLETIANSLRGLVKDCEVKGYVYNELRERAGRDYGYDVWNNNDDVFNLDVIDTMYDDRIEFAHEIIDLINYDEISDEYRSENQAVQKAYELWLEKNVIGKTDDGRFEQFIALVADSGYTLTQTPIPQTDYVQNCVAYKNEEYHFFLGELYGADSASAFFGKIQAALAKRLMEKLEQTALIQKSVNVFVGFNDSIESGNCQSGTQEFCHRHHIDTKHIGGLRGDVILGMEFSNFTRRAVMQAIVRQGGAA